MTVTKCAQKRAIECGKLAIEQRICGVFGSRAARQQQSLDFLRKPRFFRRSGGSSPEVEDGALRNGVLRPASGVCRFGVEVPDVLVTEPIGVRIAGEHMTGDIGGEVPGLVFHGQGKIDGGQVARMAGAWTNDKGDKISDVDAHFYQFDLGDFGSLGDTRRQALPNRSLTQLERPTDSVAALGMGVDDLRGDPHLACDRTLPADNRVSLGRGVDGDRMGLHVAGDAHVLVR